MYGDLFAGFSVTDFDRAVAWHHRLWGDVETFQPHDTELVWTLVARTGYSDAKMGLANAMAYFSILLSILFTVYFFRKLAAARSQIGAEW